MPSPRVDVHRAADRFRSAVEGVETRHCFSYGEHYDPANTSFGPLVALNDEVLQPGFGFEWHRHAAVEIVTWVVSGTLHHEDSTGNAADMTLGVVQRLSAGSGVQHAERAAPSTSRHQTQATEPTRFVQMWLVSDLPIAEPSYESRVVEHGWSSGFAVVASGRPGHQHETAVSIAQAGASVLAARLVADQSVVLPDSPLVHVYVVRGAVQLDGADRLDEGDSARLFAVGALGLRCLEEAEILVVEMDSSPGRAIDHVVH